MSPITEELVAALQGTLFWLTRSYAAKENESVKRAIAQADAAIAKARGEE